MAIHTRFVAAHAETPSLPVGTHLGDLHHSPVLEAWGSDLYVTVADDLSCYNWRRRPHAREPNVMPGGA